ncbi:MAG: cobalamin-binding protein [Burkholderiales bacterium]|nr:cobalamin-binding protein [Burkholderiales bacterium]
MSAQAPAVIRALNCAILLALCWATLAQADVNVLDDAKRPVSLKQPAKRIISLAPHVTELVFAAGAGDRLVAISDYSDFPEQAKQIPSIGSIFALDLERLLALKPDLVIIWGTGNAKQLAKKLRDNKLVVFESEAHDYEDIASSIERIATLAGTDTTGKAKAQEFRQRLQNLRAQYRLKAGEKPITVFHQMVKNPLMTVNHEHFISKMIQLCGGQNVFADLKDISSAITVEALLLANPDMIFSGGKENGKLPNEWAQLPRLNAVKNHAIYSVNGDWLHRSGPRVLDATEQLCLAIKEVREHR